MITSHPMLGRPRLLYFLLVAYFVSLISLFSQCPRFLPLQTTTRRQAFYSVFAITSLNFMYTGTLIFSHCSHDHLSSAFAILRAALYLSLDPLHDEIQARIVQEMFIPLIPFEGYERLTNGKCGTGGCRS